MKLAILSDTHGLLRPEILPQIVGAKAILHGGDVGDPAILERLQAVAPVHAVRGNTDHGALLAALPPHLTLELEGHRIHLLHDLADLALDPAANEIELVVFGHSHRPTCYEKGGVRYLNPGAIGPRRFRLPIAYAWVEWTGSRFGHRFVEL